MSTVVEPVAQVSEHAPAKLILVGEHAVVYGEPAVALPFPPLVARATALPIEVGVRIRSDRYPELVADLGQSLPEALRPVAAAVQGALDAIARTGKTPLAFELHLTSQIPPGSGLGSSAAVAVAAIRATFALHGSSVMPALLRMLATQAEAVAHGNSSGLDPATVASDGPIRFVRDHAPVPLRVGAPFGLVVADSGQSAPTLEMVARVRAQREADPAAAEALTNLGALSDSVVERLEAGDYAEVGTLLDQAQTYLADLGLSTERLDAVVAAARRAGAYGAKLSGAGGGGCAIALCPIDRLSEVAHAMVAAGAVTAWPTQYVVESESTHEPHRGA